MQGIPESGSTGPSAAAGWVGGPGPMSGWVKSAMLEAKVPDWALERQEAALLLSSAGKLLTDYCRCCGRPPQRFAVGGWPTGARMLLTEHCTCIEHALTGGRFPRPPSPTTLLVPSPPPARTSNSRSLSCVCVCVHVCARAYVRALGHASRMIPHRRPCCAGEHVHAPACACTCVYVCVRA